MLFPGRNKIRNKLHCLINNFRQNGLTGKTRLIENLSPQKRAFLLGFGVFYVKIVPVAHADGGKEGQEGIKFPQAVVPHPGPPLVGEGGE